MANGFTIITSRDNTFFTNNKMTIGSGIPTSGSYKVGDIIISDSQADGIFGWVCTQEGTPGKWEVIGSGAGGGNSVLVEYSNVVEFTDARTSIDIGIPEYNKETDILEVHYNGLLLAEGVHYSINEAGTAITNLNGSWNVNADDTQAMIFVVRKSTAGLNVVPMRNVVDINSATMEVEMGIGNFNPASDIISVHLNGVLLMQDIDYRIENGKLIKVDQSEAWNPNNVVGQKMYIEVLRNKGSVNEPDIGSIRKEHLTSELAAEINNNTNSINSLTGIANDHTTLINNLTEQIGNVDFSEVEAKIGNLPSLQTNAKNSLVDAVNELFQSANNGKELIANAIGEPVSAEDTFSAMSTGINRLLSTFKTNMMNNGVSVAGTDKFKQLIDKLATLADSEGKGLQYKTGNLDDLNFEAGTSTSETRTLDVNFGFTPNIVFIEGKTIGNIYGEDNIPVLLGKDVDVIINDQLQAFLTITSYNSTSITFKFRRYSNEIGTGVRNLIYHAIGVGEEDTALRDSLASILEDEGVVVTPEDDMASLIAKTDEEFDRKNNNNSSLNIISATELPETGVNNQICVITDNPVDAFITTTNFDDTNGVSTDYITLYLGNTASFDATEGTLIELNQGNLLSRYYFVKACQGENRLDSYYWLNNQWNQLTQSGIYFVENGVERNHDYFGGIKSGEGATFNTNGLTLLYSYDQPYKEVTPKNSINFSLYDKLDITIRNPDTSTSYNICVGFASTNHFASQECYPSNYNTGNQPNYSGVTDAYKEIQATRGQTVNYTVDISSWTGEGWLFLATFNGNKDLYITDLKLY